MVMSFMIISIVAFFPHIIFIPIPISYISHWLRIAGCSSLWPSESPLKTAQFILSDLQCHLSPLTEPMSLGLPRCVLPAQNQPYRLLS